MFFLSIDLLIESVELIGTNTAREFLSITDNPLISLFAGLLITAIVQSSSTTTSMIVAIVASGTLTFENAIPMIMGANIGTTLTSNLVSLSFIGKKVLYHRAFTAGIMHDLFNVILVVILFPLEYYFNILSSMAYAILDIFNNNFSSPELAWNIDSNFIGYVSSFLIGLISNPVITLILSVILLFISIKVLSNFISKRLITAREDKISHLIFDSPWKSFGVGALFTAGIQSSSITTSIIVPVAATGTIPLRSVFPYIVGANIGTTITALIASFFISTDAITIAFIHVIFNLLGVIIFMLIPVIKNMTIYLAIRFGSLTTDYRLLGLAYIVMMFFILPFALIYLSK